MIIKIRAEHIEGYLKAFAAAPETTLKNLALALTVSLRDIREYAKKNHRFIFRTGKLEAAIKQDRDKMREGKFGGRVYLNTGAGGAPYGGYVHEGTKPHLIKPIHGKLLRWVDARSNKFVFARLVRHPGTAPDPFIEEAGQRMEPKVQVNFERYALRAMKEAGL